MAMLNKSLNLSFSTQSQSPLTAYFFNRKNAGNDDVHIHVPKTTFIKTLTKKFNKKSTSKKYWKINVNQIKFKWIKKKYDRKNIKQRKKIPLEEQKLWIIFILSPLLFFYFNTQMHERYSHPAIILLFAYGLVYKKYFIQQLCNYR